MKTIKQSYIINAKPEEVFMAIINPLTIELWSGYEARIEAKEGTEFSLFEGNIAGKNLKIVPNRQLIQEWYFGDQEEKSVVTIDLRVLKNKTRVELLHINVPDEVYEEFREGWKESYWGPIRNYFK